jgi:hypothetical protein
MELIYFVFTVLNAHALSSSYGWNILRLWKLVGDLVQLEGAFDGVKEHVCFRHLIIYSIESIKVSCQVFENTFTRQNLIARWSLSRINLKTPVNNLFEILAKM